MPFEASMLYFAYGSTMLSSRMKQRVPSARLVAVGLVEGFKLCFNKRGRDGSGKGHIRKERRSTVYGVVYGIASSDKFRTLQQMHVIARRTGDRHENI